MLITVLKKYKITPKKSLGQNFLNNPEAVNKLISFIDPSEEDVFIEIGSGLGALTFPLARKVKKVFAFETDNKLIKISEELKQDLKNIEFINQDILRLDIGEFIEGHFPAGEKARVAGNLPYYISTPILFQLLKIKSYVKDITVMLQKELAMRLMAGTNSRDYGSLTIFFQVFADIKTGFEIEGSSFYPAPDVDSTVIKIIPLPEPRIDISDYEMFSKLVKTSFAQRRKTLKNNMKNLDEIKKNPQLIDSLFSFSGINPGARAESLSVFEFKKLYDALMKIRCI